MSNAPHMENSMQSEYDYPLPPELVAHAPALPRDSSRLLAYDAATDHISIGAFSGLAERLPARSLLVLNDTKVVPARLELRKRTGGAVRVLFLFNEWDRSDMIRGLPDRGVAMGDELYLGATPIVRAESHADEEHLWRLLVPPAEFSKLADEHGMTPLPPYIRSELSESERRERYQTTFAASPASVAAPTASLHFTDRVFESLAEKGIERATVTLHVGRGTFSPVTAGMSAAGALHKEPIRVSAEAARRIRAAKLAGRPVVAAGTTAMRVLESAHGSIMRGEGYAGDTDIFIRPPYEFAIVDGLITNFHLPGTSLLMLLDAFLRSKGAARSWCDLYEIAIAERFRFYSFGDAMLIM